MADFLRDETIATWVGDYCESAAFAAMPQPAKEYAEEVLPAFLRRACEERDAAPGDVIESDMKPALLEGVGGLGLPASVRAVAPELCGSFLEELERQGRLGDGRTLGLYVRALADALKGGPIRNPGSKLGRNDPCPCGSGKKYKQCCMRRAL
ncbi:MAG: SEC-C metal-binding domain-containing protein [Planctomycetota bacterium]|jgi:hypothetical protein